MFTRTHQQLAAAMALMAMIAPAQVAAQQPPTDCSIANPVPNKVFLTWPDVPTEDTVASLPTPSIPLLISSLADVSLTYELKGVVFAGGRRLEPALGSGVLPPFGTLVVPVLVDSFDVDTTTLEFSGSIFVEVELFEGGVGGPGALIERGYSRVIYFHPDAAGGMLFYGRQARHDQYHGGDLFQQFVQGVPDSSLQGVFEGGAGSSAPPPPEPPQRHRRKGAPHTPSRLTGPFQATPIVPHGPGNISLPPWRFCLRWTTQSIDSGFGEDYYTDGDRVEARGALVWIDHPNWVSPKPFTADDNGCVSFLASENIGFEVTVYAQSSLGDNDNVLLRAYESVNDFDMDPVNNLPRWFFTADPGGYPHSVDYDIEYSEEGNLLAWGSHIFYQVDSLTQPGLSGNQDMILVSDNPDCNGGSCQSENFIEMQPGKSNRKFLVGHEVGHWIHRKWSNDDLGIDNASYGTNCVDADCAFNGVGSHAMRSKERSTGAMIEGFAHFLSALAFNDASETTGWFKYYKEVQAAAYADMEADNWMVDLEGEGVSPVGGVSAWFDNMCPFFDGLSVEMDWLRFYWDYLTDAGVGAPDMHTIFSHIKYRQENYPINNTNMYDKLLEAIQDGGLGQLAHELRWVSLAASNGVDQ